MRGMVSPCCLQHDDRDLNRVVPGDDFVFAGVETNLEWARRRMEKSFLGKVIGRLSRTCKNSSARIRLEAGERHQLFFRPMNWSRICVVLSMQGLKNRQRKDDY